MATHTLYIHPFFTSVSWNSMSNSTFLTLAQCDSCTYQCGLFDYYSGDFNVSFKFNFSETVCWILFCFKSAVIWLTAKCFSLFSPDLLIGFSLHFHIYCRTLYPCIVWQNDVPFVLISSTSSHLLLSQTAAAATLGSTFTGQWLTSCCVEASCALYLLLWNHFFFVGY